MEKWLQESVQCPYNLLGFQSYIWILIRFFLNSNVRILVGFKNYKVTAPSDAQNEMVACVFVGE